ncbi:MAG: hypothetical protein WCF26_09510 [Candidatus Sulfotelmatobacter sp.]
MGLNIEGAESRTDLHIHTGAIEAPYKSQGWYEAYMAALFESDRAQIGESIRRAEFLILNRERELLSGPSDRVERRALNNARHALRALRGCLKS